MGATAFARRAFEIDERRWTRSVTMIGAAIGLLAIGVIFTKHGLAEFGTYEN